MFGKKNKYSNEDLEAVLETYSRIINSYDDRDRVKKKEILDPIIGYILKSKGYEYKLKKKTCEYYQKDNHIFINRIKDNKGVIITKKGLETAIKNNFDYAYCTVDPKNFKEFAKVFDFKSHNLSYGGLSTKTRVLIDLGCAAVGVAVGSLIWDNFLFKYGCGLGSLLLSSRIVNKISDKQVGKNLERLFEFNRNYRDIAYNKEALIRLLKDIA